MTDITVCLATIPPRAAKLARALASVAVQSLQPAAIVVEFDHDREGAPTTKNRALAKVTTEFVAFIDDDDTVTPEHLAILRASAEETGADVTYGWYEVLGGTDPRPDRFGVPFDADLLRVSSYIHTAPLVRTKLLQAAGGFQHRDGSKLDDWGAWKSMLELGASFHHVPARTYLWSHDGGNTSGDQTRW
jgi:glycosyltransferase involved in cell wall biosynthesis